MKSAAPSGREAVTAALDRFDAAQGQIAALPFDILTGPEPLTVKNRLETISRRQAAVDHRLTRQPTCQGSPIRVGRQVVYRHAVHSVADRSNGYPRSTFVLHPNGWEAIELALLSTSAVEFQGLPFDAQRRTLWTLAVTVTKRRQRVWRTLSCRAWSD
jgi:hypothetical protein